MATSNNDIETTETEPEVIELNDAKTVDSHELVVYARNELLRAGFLNSPVKEDAEVADCTMLLMKCMAMYINDTFQYGTTVDLFKRLQKMRPLTPIEDNPEDWEDMTEELEGKVLLRHKRCASVFKGADGKAFNVEGMLLIYPNGKKKLDLTKSCTPIKEFPYIVKEPIPTHVDEEGNFYN